MVVSLPRNIWTVSLWVSDDACQSILIMFHFYPKKTETLNFEKRVLVDMMIQPYEKSNLKIFQSYFCLYNTVEPLRKIILKKKKIKVYFIDICPECLPRDSFSPESGGRVNPRTAMLDMRRQGMIRLEK